MIARARAVAHGNAYTTYATLKKDAEFVCCENMAGDMTAAVTDNDLDNIWLQFKYAGENYSLGIRMEKCRRNGWTWRIANGLPCCTMMPRVGFYICILWCRALPSTERSMTPIL